MSDKPADLIRICPFHRTVEVVHWSGIGRELNDLIAPPLAGEGDESWAPNSGLFCFAHGGQFSFIVDDEGLFTDWPSFSTPFYGQTLTGRALIAGTDDMGNTVSPPDIEALTKLIARTTIWGAIAAEPTIKVYSGADAFDRYFGS